MKVKGTGIYSNRLKGKNGRKFYIKRQRLVNSNSNVLKFYSFSNDIDVSLKIKY